MGIKKLLYDLDGDGQISKNEVDTLDNYVKHNGVGDEEILTEEQIKISDLDNNGKVNTIDTARLNSIFKGTEPLYKEWEVDKPQN